VFGRSTHDGMAEYWPSADAVEHSPDMARRMNDTPKIVVSTTSSTPRATSPCAGVRLHGAELARHDNGLVGRRPRPATRRIRLVDAGARQPPADRSDHRPIGVEDLGCDGALEYGEAVAQHDDLGILGPPGA
jgi:hypothetical protein